MSGRSRAHPCTHCGVRTTFGDGICLYCRREEVQRACRLCGGRGARKFDSEGHCSSCALVLDQARSYVPTYADALGSGRWVQSGGIKVWREAS